MNAATLRSAIGGPNALTGWSLVALLPLGGLLGMFWGLRNGLTLSSWLPVVIGVHLLLIPPLLVCRSIMIRVSAKKPRPWLGLGVFAFLGGLRALMVAIAATPMGVTLPSGTVIDVVPNGMGSGIVILGVVAVVVDGSRRNRAVAEQLAALDSAFERTRAFDEAELAELEARTVAQITSVLEQELRKLQSEGENAPEHVAARLGMLANDVARPLSHSLAQGYEWIPDAEDITVRPPRWERIKGVIADIRPAHPLVPVLLIELIALPTVISEPVGGVGFAASMMLLLGGIIWALSWVVARLWPTGRTTTLRLIALIMLYAAIGMAAAWVRTIIVEWHTGLYNPLWVAPFFLILTSMGVSLTAAIQALQRNDQDRLAMTIARNAQLSARVRERTRRAQRRIARFLHSDVQAELTAAAFDLSTRERPGVDPTRSAQRIEEVITRVSAAAYGPEGEHAAGGRSAKQQVLDLVGLWSSALPVTVSVDDAAWEALDADAAALAAATEVIAEGLTNAVRHGDAGHADLALEVMASNVLIRLRSSGVIRVGSAPGLGSRFISESTSAWSIDADQGAVLLTATVPLVTAQ